MCKGINTHTDTHVAERHGSVYYSWTPFSTQSLRQRSSSLVHASFTSRVLPICSTFIDDAHVPVPVPVLVPVPASAAAAPVSVSVRSSQFLFLLRFQLLRLPLCRADCTRGCRRCLFSKPNLDVIKCELFI